MKEKSRTMLIALLLLGGFAVQAKTVINYPTIPSSPYTGGEQTANVPSSPDYDLVMPVSGTSVGSYDVYLELTDGENTKWPDTDEEIGSTTWSITKAANEWTTEPSIESWTYGDPASTPVATAKFGTPTVTFSGTAKDGTIYTDVSSVAKAGTYTCKFTLAGTSNYDGLEPVVKNFEIKVATPGGGGGSGNVNIDVTGYDGPYDGNDHQISVVITGDDAPTFTVTYSDAQEGPFKSENTYKYKEIGTHTVWYCLKSVNYATVTNSSVVKISQREIMPPTIASKEYNGAMQKADVAETADYTVEYNGEFKEAGTHEDAVVLALKDKTHCKWADGAEDPVLLSFTITKSASNVWLTEPSITGWQYGEAAHIPVAVPKYGIVSVLYDGTTTDGTEIKDATAVSKAGSYTAKFTVSETASYNGLSQNVAFTIERGKIDIGGGGSGGAKLEVTNYAGTYDGDEHTAAIAVTGDASSSFALTYSLTESGAYTVDKPVFTNVCETTKIWYSISSPDYQTITNFATVTITARDIANATIAPIAAVEYAGVPVKPVPTVTDGTPSIITAGDYTVSYANNNAPGTATLTLTGKGNYTGTKSANFTITSAEAPAYAMLKGELAWKLNFGSGCYTAQLKLTCTNGLDKGISGLRFLYQDRTNGTVVASALYDSNVRAFRPTVDYAGTAYRYVDLNAAKIATQGAAVTYGVLDVSAAKGVVARSECSIELYVRSLASPVSDLGYVVWTSNGSQCALPITASGGSQGMTVKPVPTAGLTALAAPLSLSALNASLALGVALDPASSPYCRLSSFAAVNDGLVGCVEVGKVTSGRETSGSLGANARVTILGATAPDGAFSELGSVSADADGSFRFGLADRTYSFFRVRIDVVDVID